MRAFRARPPARELSPIFGDGLKDQAAAHGGKSPEILEAIAFSPKEAQTGLRATPEQTRVPSHFRKERGKDADAQTQ